MLYSYYLGLDLGQSSDYSALCVAEEPLWVPDEEMNAPGWAWYLGLEEAGWVSPAALTALQAEETLSHNFHDGRPHGSTLSVRHLERFPLGTPYPKVIEEVRALLRSPVLSGKRKALLVDKTGVGAAVVDSFEQAGVPVIPVTIHGGGVVGTPNARLGETGYRVPKRDLVSATQVLMQNRRLSIASSLPEAKTLKSELLKFRIKIDPRTAHDSYEHWREGDHDDLVLATAMACWFRQWWNDNLDRANASREVA